MNKILKNEKGFSIIEIIIYLAIFTMISLLVINSLLTVMTAFSKIRNNRSILEAGMNSMERMSRDIRQSKSIDLLHSNLGAGILQLNSTDESGNPIIIKFSKENSKLDLYQAGVLSGNLLGPYVNLDSLTFRKITTTRSEAVKIEMSINDKRSKTNQIRKFYDTIILRGGY